MKMMKMITFLVLFLLFKKILLLSTHLTCKKFKYANSKLSRLLKRYWKNVKTSTPYQSFFYIKNWIFAITWTFAPDPQTVKMWNKARRNDLKNVFSINYNQNTWSLSFSMKKIKSNYQNNSHILLWSAAIIINTR